MSGFRLGMSPSSSILALGQTPGEGELERGHRHTLILGGLLMSLGGVFWGVTCFASSLWGPSVIPLGYGVATTSNLWRLERTKRLASAKVFQVALSLIFPFLFQWSLGGIRVSGVVMLWSMVALAGMLMLSSARQSFLWFGFHMVLIAVSFKIDPWLDAHAAFEPGRSMERWLVVANVASVSTVLFVMTLVLTGRQRAVIEAIEAGEASNLDLTAQLRRTVEGHERDIQRLRVVEAELLTLTTSLERQVEERTEALQLAVERAEAATRAKSEFLAVMSHEIRTPLNGILATVDLLNTFELDQRHRVYLDVVRRSGDLLLSIINDLLDFSRIEAGKLELVARPFEVLDEVQAVLDLHRPVAQDRGLELMLEGGPGLPHVVSVDGFRFLQILGNLVSNAVKFTEVGRILVRLDFEPQGSVLRVTVDDTGQGIAPELMGNLFKPFTQGDAGATRRRGGTGLGLAICSRLVGAMGGSMEVRSALGVGSTFEVRVPVQRDMASARPTQAPAHVDPSPAIGAPVVLLAEDDPVNQLVARGLLEAAGCEVDVVGDGAQAVRRVLERAYDLVLMDMRMPEVDGPEAVRRIRRLDLPRQPRIVALTANAFTSDQRICLEAGMDGFVAKPLRMEVVQRMVLDARARA
jgi:signal transduction histidine kinase